MAQVFVVSRLIGPSEWEINGVFSTREAAAKICTSDNDAVVTFDLDRDCTDQRTFEVAYPTISPEPSLVTV